MRPKLRLRGGDHMRRGKTCPTLRCSQKGTEALSGKRIQLCARQLASNDEFDHWQLCFGKAQTPFTKRQGTRIRDSRRQRTNQKSLFKFQLRGQLVYNTTRTRPSLQPRGQVRPLVRGVRKLVSWWWSLFFACSKGVRKLVRCFCYTVSFFFMSINCHCNK